MTAAVFLDRDGVINENRDDYVKGWEEVCFLPGALEALARLAATPFRVLLITNQSPIGRGILTAGQVEATNRRLVEEIGAHGGRIDGIYYCPHCPDDGCDCRKPRPGLLLRAARELEIDLRHSYLVGDAISDVEAGLAAGCRPIMVLTGLGQEQRTLLHQRGYHHVPVVRDVGEAVGLVLSQPTT